MICDMKQHATIIWGSLCLVLPSVLLGQSTFELRNYNPLHGVNAPVFDADGIPLAGFDYRAELWGGSSSNALAPLLDISRGNSREMAAFVSGGYVVGTSAFLSVLDVPPSGWAWLQLRAWDYRLGATYEVVSVLGLGGYGESPLFYAQGGNPVVIPATPGGPLIGLQSFSLRPVPEPSVWALLALGGIAVGWAVRRQQRVAG